MKTYPYTTPDGIIELVRKDEHDAIVTEINTVANQTVVTFTKQVDDLRADLTRYSAEREHNAMQALMWQSVAERLADSIKYALLNHNICPELAVDKLESAIAAYESAKSGNLPDPLAEAVKRMETVPYDLLMLAYDEAPYGEGDETWINAFEAVRARLISAAKGEQP